MDDIVCVMVNTTITPQSENNVTVSSARITVKLLQCALHVRIRKRILQCLHLVLYV